MRWPRQTVAVSIAFVATMAAADPTESDEARQALTEKAIQEYDAKGSLAAVEYVRAQSNPLIAVQSLSDLTRHCYWKQRDLSAALVFARAGVQHGLTTAATLSKTNPQGATKLRATAKGLTFDIASFTWPGWNQEGIEISEEQLAEGLQAARANLRLAKELKKGSLPMSRAYWMLGAQELAAGNMQSSSPAFLKAAAYAKEASSRVEELMAKSYVGMLGVLSAEDAEASAERLHGLLADLRKEKDGAFLADQVETALQVFRKRNNQRDAAPDADGLRR